MVQRKASPFVLLAVLIPCLASPSSVGAEEVPAAPQALGPVKTHPSKPDAAQKPRTHGHPEITIRNESRVILPPYDMSTELRPAKPNLHAIGSVRPVAPNSRSPQQVDLGDACVSVLSIKSPAATEIRVHFANFAAGAEEQVFVYSARDPDDIAGPYGPPAYSGDFWSPPVAGDEAVVELERPGPCGAEASFPFDIDRVSHIFENPSATADLFAVSSLGNVTPLAGSCELPVPSAWATTSRAVALLQYVSDTTNYVCSGTLLSTQAGDLTPYLLTANHCFSTQSEAQSIRAVWRFETAGQSVSSRPHSDEADLLLTKSLSTGSDYTLLMIKGALPADLLLWAGWTTAMPTLYTSVVGLHHPGPTLADAYTRYSIGDISASLFCTSPGANFLSVDWDIFGGATEPGSSGSGLWIDNTANPQLVGQLLGGCSSCSSIVGDDYYGRFDVTYNNIGANSSPHYLSAGRDDDFTPNNSRATARLVSSGTYANRVVKYYSEDWYRISVPAGGTIRTSISFTNAYGDIDLELYRGSDTSPIATSSGTSNTETVQVVNTGATSDYYARVYLYSSTRNTYSITATVTAGDTTAPTVSITYPTSSGTWAASSSNLSIAGSASDNVGVTSVTWASDRGVSGTAVGTSPTWSASGITIYPGTNNLTVTARDAAGNSGTAHLVVTYYPPPSVTTNAATNVGQTTAVLNGTVNPNGTSTSAFFAYGTAPNPGSPTTPPQQVGSGTSSLPVSASISGLACGTTYYFHAIATSTQGTPVGADLTFTTSSCTCSVGTPSISAPASVVANSTGNTSSATATNAVAYTWSITNGSITSSNTAQTITFTAGSSGVVTLAVTAAAAGGCTAQAQKAVTITTPPARRAPYDFDNDGKSDLVWRNAVSGDTWLWLMNSNVTTASRYIANMPSAWTIAATADIDGDGKADLIWRNATTGDTWLWLMNGSVVLASRYISNLDSGWSIAAAADFDNDGKYDLVWRNAITGDTWVWLMNGNGVTSSRYIGNLGAAWSIAGAGDLDGDGKADLIWRNTTTGDTWLWSMNGGVVLASRYIGNVAPAWSVAAVGDFDGDLKSDIVWRNASTGDTWLWLMNANAVSAYRFIATVSSPWSVAATGDFDNDGKRDIVWRNPSSGDTWLWLMNGNAVTAYRYITNISSAWSIGNR